MGTNSSSTENDKYNSLFSNEYRDYNPGNNFENKSVQKSVKELFDLFEAVVINKQEGYSTSRTSFDFDYVLEIENKNRFLRLLFDAEQLDLPKSFDNVEALVDLSYTAQDIKPIRGKIIDSRRFQGVVEHFYLLDGSWYLLNPKEFSKCMALEDFLITEESIKNRILKDVFED